MCSMDVFNCSDLKTMWSLCEHFNNFKAIVSYIIGEGWGGGNGG